MRKLMVLAIILSLLIPTFTMAKNKNGEEDILMGMLKELKGEFLEGDINMGGIILDEFISKEDMETMAEEIKNSLDLVGQRIEPNRDIMDLEEKYFSQESIYEEDFNHTAIYGYDPKGNPMAIMISSYLNPEFNKGETTLFINIIKVEKNFNINGIIEKVESIFKDFDKSVEITTCVVGTIQGKLDRSSMEKDMARVLKKFKGKTVEKYFDETLRSYTVFTPLIENFIFSGEKKINLNLAIRYNEYEDKTYIWIGTPIITTGY